MTVSGLIPADSLGRCLPHEHVLVDFAGAERALPPRYDRDSAFTVILPYLNGVVARGLEAFIECTPAYLGRDPLLLRRLSRETGLHILTNTGYYAARSHAHLPGHALEETADQLAARWIADWENGIDGTGVRPGFIKIGVDAGPLSEAGERIVRAAARTHLATGLTIAAHTGDAEAAKEQVKILAEEGVDLSAWIWVHAQNGKESIVHENLAKNGAWLSFDGLNETNVRAYVNTLSRLKERGFLPRLLVSHDAGWYHVGEPGGGSYRPYTTLFDTLLPALEKAGWSAEERRMLTVGNPARAFSVGKRAAASG